MLLRSLFIKLPFFNHMHCFMPSLVKRHGGVVVGVPVAIGQEFRGFKISYNRSPDCWII